MTSIPIPIPMEDEALHTASRPFCDDATCPCHGLPYHTPHGEEWKQAIMIFPDQQRVQVMRELLEENELSVHEVEAYYSEADALPVLHFFVDQDALNQVRDFMYRAQTINLASSYQIIIRREA